MASIAQAYYRLHSASQLKWTATQEKTLSNEYPFADLHAETPEQYVQRTYLQFLWLPQSIMPLHLLVPSMLRVDVASSSQPVPPMSHPLHALLDHILLSVRSTSNKYHVELPQILADGGGAGEAEENMMWYALNHEKGHGDDDRTHFNNESHIEGPWIDDAWKKKWLERMEQREVQIQILLHLLKISLPGPCPALHPDVELRDDPSKKRRRRKPEPQVVSPSTEELLESFMDKISMWQLLGSIDISGSGPSAIRKDERDWMQIFCEDLVEQQFKTKLPELCHLFRSKVFPNSVFSDDASSNGAPSRSSSPMLVNDISVDSGLKISQKRERSSSGASASNHSRYPFSTTTTTSTSHKNASGTATSFSRSRSRSLSVSLAHDADTRRSGSVGVTKKPTLNREVSMSRVFKEKLTKKEGTGKKDGSKRAKITTKATAELKSKVKVDQGVTLVSATPVKGQPRRRVQTKLFSSAGVVPLSRTSKSPSPGITGNIEEEDWSLLSSPDVLLLNAGSEGSDEGICGTAEHILADDTPVKKRRRAQ